ncbi:MAG: heavy-metal-associated domain-containing protein [Synergistaceae bacterium]|nr:heavy-metal-associated domain-containing protein [Synergistaceae bacterium]
MTEETIQISGMACPVCARGIEKAVGGLDGVARASVSFDKEELSLKYDERRLPGLLLREVVSGIVGDVTARTRRVSVSVPVYGMSCPECAAGIEEILSGKSGVLNASVNVSTGRAEVVYDPKRTDFRRLKHVVENARCGGRYHGEAVMGKNDPCECLG